MFIVHKDTESFPADAPPNLAAALTSSRPKNADLHHLPEFASGIRANFEGIR